jgi:hypothetical protein
LVVVSGSNSVRLLVEVPFLGSSSISGLDDNVSVVDDVKISVCFELRDNEEWSLNEEAEVLIEFSFSWFTLPVTNVDDVPLL